MHHTNKPSSFRFLVPTSQQPTRYHHQVHSLGRHKPVKIFHHFPSLVALPSLLYDSQPNVSCASASRNRLPYLTKVQAGNPDGGNGSSRSSRHSSWSRIRQDAASLSCLQPQTRGNESVRNGHHVQKNDQAHR